DSGSIARHPHRVSMNVDVFDVDGTGESLERIVVEAMQRSEQAQVFRYPLRQGLREGVVMNRERNITTHQLKGFETILVVGIVFLAAPERDQANQFAASFQR